MSCGIVAMAVVFAGSTMRAGSEGDQGAMGVVDFGAGEEDAAALAGDPGGSDYPSSVRAAGEMRVQVDSDRTADLAGRVAPIASGSAGFVQHRQDHAAMRYSVPVEMMWLQINRHAGEILPPFDELKPDMVVKRGTQDSSIHGGCFWVLGGVRRMLHSTGIARSSIAGQGLP